jgi:hypothetical protein
MLRQYPSGHRDETVGASIGGYESFVGSMPEFASESGNSLVARQLGNWIR